jgi:hypothetical protein
VRNRDVKNAYAPSPRLVASTSRLGREILDGVAKRPKLIEAMRAGSGFLIDGELFGGENICGIFEKNWRLVCDNDFW